MSEEFADIIEKYFTSKSYTDEHGIKWEPIKIDDDREWLTLNEAIDLGLEADEELNKQPKHLTVFEAMKSYHSWIVKNHRPKKRILRNRERRLNVR